MFQKHSDTSKEAWENLTSAATDSAMIYDHIKNHDCHGISAPWVASNLGLVPGTVAARVVGLERTGRIIRLERTEMTPHGRQANILVADIYKDEALENGDVVVPVVPEAPKHDDAAKRLAQMLYDKMQLLPDNQAVIQIDALDLSIVENLALRAGLSKE